MAKDTNATKAVGLLIEAANADTVYRDLYLRRARQLLGATLDESAYRAIGSTEKEIEDLMRRSRSAVLQRDWDQAAESVRASRFAAPTEDSHGSTGRYRKGCV